MSLSHNQAQVCSKVGTITPALPEDHPAVHASFFRFVERVTQWYDQKRPGLAQQPLAAFDRDIEKYFGLQPSEWQAVVLISRQVATDRNAAELAIQTHANARAKYDLPPQREVVKPLL